MGERAINTIEQAYFTTAQAAQYAGKTVRALRHAVLRGQLVAVARGKRGRHATHMFTKADLDNYVRGV